ncbi:MAG: TrmH family RNA methyltransferase [Saprospiraceae bacterium]
MNKKIKQLTHTETVNLSKTFPVVVICEDFQSPENIGMTFRIADAMGVAHLYLTGNSPTLPHRKITKTARSADKRVPFSHRLDTAGLLQQLKQEGYTLIGLEITNQSADIRKFDFVKLDKIAFIAGAERYGISESTLAVLDATVFIPMYGVGTSMNVVTALSIGLYEITKQMEKN